ncbi:MAG: sulfurtransferase [Micavibrio aeruginosavorus]|uniref:Sulfurtransferase n=1 Tax=Micavibrio aeruginosavorus TaxID=349221 RepID=A0A2W5FI79_9BACT|nr:MAG: sulfurtransferase [Micavibrio aeruginosavorus]
MVKYSSHLQDARESGLIQPQTLFSLMQSGTPNIKLVDASYPADLSLPAIGNAVTFDIDDIADPDSPIAHMLPPPEIFAAKMQSLGIASDDFVVCYDQSGFIMAASRAWWMFRVFGHDNVAVLDGGLTGWMQKSLPVLPKTTPEAATVPFTVSYKPELVIDYNGMKSISDTKSATILDARPPGRFAPDHIPNSQNLPALALIGPDRHLKPSGFTPGNDSPIVATCGSGVTACAIALALFKEGIKNVSVYDGSWTEWSTRAGK